MNEYKATQKLMGSVFELIVAHDDEQRARELLLNGVNEISRIEKLLTEFSDDSNTALVGRCAGVRPVKVDAEVYRLIERSIKISQLTQGAFDITAAPLKKLYNFKTSDFVFPGDAEIKHALSKVGFQHIILTADSKVMLRKKDMRISFAAIGKGYAADCVKKLWKENGVQSGVVNASGDLTVIGKRYDGENWKVGIADPDNRGKMLFHIPIENASVATSGDYEQFFVREGIRYSHNINTKTGMPVTGIKSVTVVSQSAELSDALATAVYVMGIDAGLYFIDQLPQTWCLIIDDSNKIFHSKKLKIEYAS